MLFLALLLASEGGSWMEWADTYLNYPGLEAWKFINLTVFILVGAFLLGTKLKLALHARGEGIRQLLTNADNERDAAQQRLTEAEALVAGLNDDVAAVRERAKSEAQMERGRIAEAAEKEIEKMRYQGRKEMETAAKVALKELQRFLANRSVELARESVRTQIRPEDDARLIDEDIGNLRRVQA